MASEERQFTVLSSESSPYNDSLVEENISMSPNGPFSDLSYGSSSYSSASSSDIGSPETAAENEDELILAELTRRMAEFTFQEDDDDDDDEDVLKRKLAAKSFLQDNYKGGEGYKSLSGRYNNNNQVIKCASKQPTVDSGLPRNPSSDIFSRHQIYKKGNQLLLMQKEGAECGGGRAKTADRKDHHHHRNIKIQDKNPWRSPARSAGSFTNGVSPVNGSGLRAVFLGGSNNSVSNGTGVFIPSSTLNKTEPKKKSGCSTVLIPARVLQTLQQHFNNVGATSQSQKASDVLARINGLLSQQQEQAVFKIQPPEKNQTTAGGNQEELQLPHEWTY